MPAFELHPRLQQDCFAVGRFSLSDILLMNDNQYPWYILVPRRSHIREIHELSESDRHLLLTESCLLAENIQSLYNPDKLNIAAIGNLVPQLHIHHVARFQSDKAWPAPIWGKFPVQTYVQLAADEEIARMRAALKSWLVD